MSAGSGASKRKISPLAGWRKRSECACNAWRRGSGASGARRTGEPPRRRMNGYGTVLPQ